MSLLIKTGIKIDINHQKVQAAFSSEIIHRRKMLPSKFKSHLQDLRMCREIADYSESDVSKSKCIQQLNMANDFFQTIFEIVK